LKIFPFQLSEGNIGPIDTLEGIVFAQKTPTFLNPTKYLVLTEHLYPVFLQRDLFLPFSPFPVRFCGYLLTKMVSMGIFFKLLVHSRYKRSRDVRSPSSEGILEAETLLLFSEKPFIKILQLWPFGIQFPDFYFLSPQQVAFIYRKRPPSVTS